MRLGAFISKRNNWKFGRPPSIVRGDPSVEIPATTSVGWARLVNFDHPVMVPSAVTARYPTVRGELDFSKSEARVLQDFEAVLRDIIHGLTSTPIVVSRPVVDRVRPVPSLPLQNPSPVFLENGNPASTGAAAIATSGAQGIPQGTPNVANPFVAHLQRIFDFYNRSPVGTDWANEVALANQNLVGRIQFNSGLPPYFYSGRLLEVVGGALQFAKTSPRMVFVTMNPQENAQVNCWKPGAMTLTDFVNRQNGWFVSAEATARGPSAIYVNCNRFARLCLTVPPSVGRYSLLNDHCAAIDWFPFFSTRFQLREANSVPRNYLNAILRGLSAAFPRTVAPSPGQAPAPIRLICVGGAIRDALRRVSATQSPVGAYLTRFDRHASPLPLYAFPMLARRVANAVLQQAAHDLMQDPP